jgi:hypothetical protein
MRYRALRGCLIALFLLGGAAISVSKDVHSHPPNDNAKLNGTGTNPQGASPAPIIVNVPAPQKTAEEKEEDAKERAEKSSNDGKIVEFTRQLANYTLGLLVATGALVLATGVLAYLGWKQARDMRESLVIAGTSADAAMISAKVAEQTLMTAETPYIIPTIVEHNIRSILNGLDTGCVDIDYSFHNYGRTPAIITQFNVECGVIERIFTITGVDDEGHYAIGPDYTYMKYGTDMCETIFKDCKSRTFKYHLDRDGEEAIFKGKHHIDRYCPVFRGNVIFSDIFGVNYIQTFILAYDYVGRQFYSAGGIENNRRRRLDPETKKQG